METMSDRQTDRRQNQPTYGHKGSEGSYASKNICEQHYLKIVKDWGVSEKECVKKISKSVAVLEACLYYIYVDISMFILMK